MNVDNLKLLGLNFKVKDHLFDLTLLLILGVITNLFFLLINKPLHDNLRLVGLPNNYDIFPFPLEIARIAFWIVVFLSVRTIVYGGAKNLIPSLFSSSYGFDAQKDRLTDERFLREWVFQGNVQPLNGGLFVSNANSGCLIRPNNLFGLIDTKKIWRNFTANIEFEFPTQTLLLNPTSPHNPSFPTAPQYTFEDYLGVVFRAQSFEDYFMLELTRIGANLVMRPHVRMGGNWDAPILNVDNNSLPLTTNAVSMNVVVNNDTVTASVVGSASLRWLLPTHVEKNLKQQPEENKNLSKNIIPEIYFRGVAGMFGFRCYGNQIALIKSLDIRR